MKIEITHRPGLFFVSLEGGKKAFLKYSMDGNTMVLVSTYIPNEYRGMGLAEKLTEKAVSYAEETKLKIRPECSYAVSFFKKHPEYQELLE